MASNSANGTMECEQDNIICPICLEIFEHPRMAPICGHSFCSKCMSNWIQHGSFVCPVCRAGSNMPGGVAKLPINRDLQKTADFYRQKQCKGQTVFCRSHPWHTENLLYCEDCNEISCAECVDRHPRHLLIGIDAARDHFKRWYADCVQCLNSGLARLGHDPVAAAVTRAQRTVDQQVDPLVAMLERLRAVLKAKCEKALLHAGAAEQLRENQVALAESMLPRLATVIQRCSLVEMVSERDKVAALCEIISSQAYKNTQYSADLPDEGFNMLAKAIAEIVDAEDLWRIYAKPIDSDDAVKPQ